MRVWKIDETVGEEAEDREIDKLLGGKEDEDWEGEGSRDPFLRPSP